jgi:gamma-glutamyltranspeptidase/glutathione hydrolase
MLSEGGAVDAALAAAFVETVALPPKCGLGGDLVALVVDAVAGTVEALVAIGPAPAGLPAAKGLPATGGLAVGVPGAPAGYAALADRALRPLSDLVAPAADLARRGVRVGPVLARLARASADLLRRHQPDGCVYLPGGEPVAEGDVVRLPGLADLLDELPVRGAGLFHGSRGRQVADVVAAHGGVLTVEDLRRARAEWSPAAWRSVGEVELAVTPAPTYGPLLADALVTLADRPRGGWAEVDAILGAERRRDVLATDGGTSVVAAADADGTAVVIVHSNSYPEFGAGIVAPGLDLVLGNRPGRGFRGPPVPGRRPPTTLHAWAVRDASRELAVGATPGGENQVAWNVQVLAHVLAAGEPGASGGGVGGTVATALAAPRWARGPDGQIEAEPGWDCRRQGSEPDAVTSTDAVTSSHVVVGRDGTGWWAAADPRQTAAVSSVDRRPAWGPADRTTN